MKFAVGDADALIALAVARDANHKKAVEINNHLTKQNITIVFPNTAILEATTSLYRVLNLSEAAQRINDQYLQGDITVEYIDEKIQHRAGKIFQESKSKKNTIFDAVVAATAEKLGTDLIFSFDHFYKSQGLKLAGELQPD
ncbi:PIN domain-containing protein [Candidatus Daviesbacteria bacterium]|nr:PIN domain-containing protein [Candidatus Daviesbacteria bacterium]